MPSKSARRTVVLALVGLVGCNRLEDTEQLAAPAVAQGLYLGLELPDGVDVSDTDLLDYTAACTVFLAYVSGADAIEDAPLEGADVEFRSAENAELPLVDQGGGEYLVTAESGLVYEPGDRSTISLEIQGEPARMAVDPPSAPDVDIEPFQVPRTPLEIDLSDQDYDNLIVAVYDINRNKLTWDNLPDSVGETYEYTHRGDRVTTQEVPGDAFPGETSYLVGVAGMKLADPDSFEGINQTLSAFMAGQFSLHYVVGRYE